MMASVKLFFIALPVFLVIDLVWLGLVAKSFYAKHLGFLMRPDPNWIAAIIFYLLFVIGLVHFVITPALEKSSLTDALLFGALFGLVTYSTYDLTNLATIKDWPLVVTCVDLAWGTTLSAALSAITYSIAKKIGL